MQSPFRLNHTFFLLSPRHLRKYGNDFPCLFQGSALLLHLGHCKYWDVVIRRAIASSIPYQLGLCDICLRLYTGPMED